MLEKAATDAAVTGIKTVEKGLRAVWSMMDAASEKKSPSQVLSPQGIQAIQGNPPGS